MIVRGGNQEGQYNMNEQHISQLEWERYAQARDDKSRLDVLADEDMTPQLWTKWRECNALINGIHEKYWNSVHELEQRYYDSLENLNNIE